MESLGGVKDNNMVAIETIVATNDGDEIIISSVLTVKDTLPNNVAGRYWCVATVSLGNNSRGNVVEIQSEMSTITMIRTIGELQDDERRCDSVILTTISTECVYFEPSNFYSLPRPLVPGPTEGPVMTTDRTTLARQDSPTVSDDNVILSSTTIIILSVVGGTLCIVIHILLAMVGCLCNRSRKRGQPRVRKGRLLLMYSQGAACMIETVMDPGGGVMKVSMFCCEIFMHLYRNHYFLKMFEINP